MDGAVSPTMPIADLIAGYRTGEIDPVAVTRRHLDRIAVHDKQLHAFLAVTAERAVRAAESARDRYQRGGTEPLPPLLGVTVALKDLFHMASVVTTAGSAMFRNVVSLSDSGVTRRLSMAGAVLLGKTNTAEFGQSATTENRLGPPTANPWDPDRTPGGSSGGSAAAVAAGVATPPRSPGSSASNPPRERFPTKTRSDRCPASARRDH